VFRSIQAYRAEVSQVRLGSLITVMVEVTIEKHKAHEHARFEQVISGEPEVVECAAVTGPFDYLLKIIARDIEGYVAVMDRIAAKYERISNYVSHVVIRQVKHSPLLASHAVRLAAPSSVEK
jgi:DNA-binding Lrp family transcriptional regulator